MFGIHRAVALIAVFTGLAAVCVCGAEAGSAVPDPCAILSASTVASTAGLKGVVLKGVRAGGACTYEHAGVRLVISVGVGGMSLPPGTTTSRPSGIGGGGFYQDSAAGDSFANVIFVKDGDGVSIWSNGKLPDAADVLALARLVYRELPG